MLQDDGDKSRPPQNKVDKPSLSEPTASAAPPKKTAPLLKLVVSNPIPLQNAIAPYQSAPSNARFSTKVCNKGQDLYEMKTQDPFHDLGCDLILEVERDDRETTVVCHFPAILHGSHRLLDEEGTLYGIIVIQFQMKVLEQLFLFCTKHDASHLIIYMDDDQAEGFGIYQDFLVHCEETVTENGEKTEMLISTDQGTFDKWRSFMAEINPKFEQELWREQRFNPTIQRYLKSRAHC